MDNQLTWRKHIEQLPQAEQLDQALKVIDYLTGNDAQALAYYSETYNLTASEAKLFHLLHNVPIMTRAAGLSILNIETQSDVVDVYLTKIRQKVPDSIKLVRGVGWKLTQRYDVPEDIHTYKLPKRELLPVEQPSIRSRPWTDEDDQELARMYWNNSDHSYIALELERTERAVKDRLRKINLYHTFTPKEDKKILIGDPRRLAAKYKVSPNVIEARQFWLNLW